MVSAVTAKIISMHPNLTVGENEIARFVMKNADLLVGCTIIKMAELTNTSEATINRFCKKLGYKGFNSFKIALAQENFYNTMHDGGDRGGEAGYIDRVGRSYRSMLLNTAAMLDEDAIVRAVSCLEAARAIHLFAYAGAAIVAREFEFKLQLAGLTARAVTDTNLFRVAAAAVEASDVVVAIVPTVLLRDVHLSLAVCKECGAKVMALTSLDSPKLDEMVDFKLITSDRITVRDAFSFSNNFIYLYVVDVLYAALLDRNPEMRRKKRDADAVLDMHQTSDNYFYQY